MAKIDENGKETFQVNVNDLGSTNWGPFLRVEPIITTNVADTLELAPLNRTDVKKGTWSRTLVGTNQVPDDILPFFGNLTQLNDTEVVIAEPGLVPDVTTVFTNIVGNITNVIDGIVIPNPV